MKSKSVGAALMIIGIMVGTFVVLAGCTASPQVGVAQSEVALTAAEKLARNYVVLPACNVGGTKVCSDPTISAGVKRADNIAYAAVKAARASNTSADLAAANAAIAAMVAAVPDLSVN